MDVVSQRLQRTPREGTQTLQPSQHLRDREWRNGAGSRSPSPPPLPPTSLRRRAAPGAPVSPPLPPAGSGAADARRSSRAPGRYPPWRTAAPLKEPPGPSGGGRTRGTGGRAAARRRTRSRRPPGPGEAGRRRRLLRSGDGGGRRPGRVRRRAEVPRPTLPVLPASLGFAGRSNRSNDCFRPSPPPRQDSASCGDRGRARPQPRPASRSCLVMLFYSLMLL